MAQPAHSPPPVGGTLPVLDVEAMLGRLPSQSRANVTWAKKPISEGLARLRSEPITDELVAAVAEQVMVPMQAIGGVAWKALATNLDSYRAAVMTDFANEEDRLAAFVDDEDSRDTVAWITGLLRAFYATVLATVTPQQRVSVDERELSALPELPSFKRGVAALMAATEEARLGGDQRRARDLVDVAFLQLTQLRDVLRRHGLQLSAFPYATTEQRRESLGHAARRVREALTSDDWSALQAARVADLR